MKEDKKNAFSSETKKVFPINSIIRLKRGSRLDQFTLHAEDGLLSQQIS